MFTPEAKDLGVTAQNSAHHADQDLVGHTELRSRSRNQGQADHPFISLDRAKISRIQGKTKGRT